jgi:WD40 repeat protein
MPMRFFQSRSPDSITALSGGDNTLKLWDVATGKETWTFAGHADAVFQSFSRRMGEARCPQ